MLRHFQRLEIILRHIKHSKCSYSTPSITVTPSTAMVDEKVDITVSGLRPNETVTIVANTDENACKFESRCVMRADEDGQIHNDRNPSLAGTFTGIDRMGLFWSLKPNFGVRLVKKDVSSPLTYNINVYQGPQPDGPVVDKSLLASTNTYRLFKKPSVKRIPVKHGRLKGTLFLPEGKGPFPALIDTFGGFVTLIETRAALLASHGYATFALSYLYGEGLPKTVLATDLNYLQEAIHWFCEQEFVDERRFGMFGLCFGGCISLYLASICPQVKVVVNVNGFTMHGGKLWNPDGLNDRTWPITDNVYQTEEGVVIDEIFDHDNPSFVPAWKHGAKVLQICGEDDKQVHPKWHHRYKKIWPEEFKSNFELVTYPGAGHLIEPPYMPLCRVFFPGRKRMSTFEFMPEKYYDEPMMTGGYPKQHAFAQEDSWNRILKFLDTNLKRKMT